MDTQFFPKIITLYRNSRNSYGQENFPGGARHVHALGQKLTDFSSTTKVVCGVFNISDSHWVALAIDVRWRLILYGDSMEPVESIKREVTEAVQWWITKHSTSDFTHVDLLIMCQVDSFSCGVFAVNLVQHLVFPITTTLLQPHESVTKRYKWFLAALN